MNEAETENGTKADVNCSASNAMFVSCLMYSRTSVARTLIARLP